MNITESLPRMRRTPCIAMSEPSASPSGFSWVTSTKRSAERSASSTCSRVEEKVSVVIEQLFHPHRAVGRVVVVELERRCALHPQLRAHAALEHAARRLQALQRLGPLVLPAQDGDVHAGMPQVG